LPRRDRLGVALLSNLSSVDAGGLAHLASEVYLHAALAPEPERRPAAIAAKPAYQLDPALLDRYVGKYRGRSGRVIAIVREGDRLKGEVTAGRPQALSPTGPHQFALTEAEGRVVFADAEKGQASRYTLEVDSESRVYDRVQPREEAPPPLEEYVGTYHSDELDLTCGVRLKEGGLVVQHRRQGELALRAISRDQFASPRIGTLRFERNTEKKITGLRVSTGRIRDLRFARMAAPSSGGAW
jgi:hypothetical protein